MRGSGLYLKTEDVPMEGDVLYVNDRADFEQRTGFEWPHDDSDADVYDVLTRANIKLLVFTHARPGMSENSRIEVIVPLKERNDSC